MRRSFFRGVGSFSDAYLFKILGVLRVIVNTGPARGYAANCVQ